MVKIALLVPNKKMLEIASSIAEEQHICVEYMKEIQTVDAVKEVRLAIESGAHIIVARGYQTKLSILSELAKLLKISVTDGYKSMGFRQITQ